MPAKSPKSRCGICKHPKRAVIDEAILESRLRAQLCLEYHINRDVMERHTAQHLPTLWERCETCARQMIGELRCDRHNPTPEQRDEREKIAKEKR